MGKFSVRVALRRVVSEGDSRLAWGNLEFAIERPVAFLRVRKQVSRKALKGLLLSIERSKTVRQLEWGALGRPAQSMLQAVHRDLVMGLRDVLYQVRAGADLLYAGVRGDLVDQRHVVLEFEDNERAILQESAPTKEMSKYLSNVLRSGQIRLPLPPANYVSRIGFLTVAKLSEIEKSLNDGVEESPAFLDLFETAQSNYDMAAHGAAVVCLTIAAETATKAMLSVDGPIAEYILTRINSPPIAQLIKCARTELNLPLSTSEQESLARMARKRNEIVHSPRKISIDEQELADWFEIVARVIRYACVMIGSERADT